MLRPINKLKRWKAKSFTGAVESEDIEQMKEIHWYPAKSKTGVYAFISIFNRNLVTPGKRVSRLF